VAEKSDRALVNVYDLKTLKKRKVLSTPEVNSSVYVSMCFSQDNQLLLTQGGAPDWTLVCWNWAKAKPMASVRVSQGSPVTQCSFSPLDSAVVCVSGQDIFRFYRIVENALRPMPQPSVPMQNFPCHVWLKQPEDHVLLVIIGPVAFPTAGMRTITLRPIHAASCNIVNIYLNSGDSNWGTNFIFLW
jgi:hypothetical protein